VQKSTLKSVHAYQCTFTILCIKWTKLTPNILFHAAKCIDHYTSLRVKKYEGKLEEAEFIDPKLESIVNRMFQRCFDDQQYKQAIGIALETRRNDILQKAICESVRHVYMV